MFNWFTDLPTSRKILLPLIVVLLVVAFLIHDGTISLF